MLDRFLAKVTAYADGQWSEPPVRPERKSSGFGWSPKTGWVPVETISGFDGLYKAGYLAGFLSNEGPGGTTMFTIAKRSDLVPFSLGPGVVDPKKRDHNYRPDTVFGQLALAEIEVNPGQAHSTNWGGGSSVGGSPRNPDGSQSRLTPEQVLEVCKAFTK